MVGFVVVGVVASWLAILGMGLRSDVLVLVALIGAGWLVWGRRKGRVTVERTPALAIEEGVVIALLVFAGGVLTWALVESPLRVGDGIVIWALKAHALFQTGPVSGPVFTGHAYAAPTHTDYPIFLPSIEALLSRFLGRYDQALLDVEFGPLLVAFGVAAWALLRRVAHRWLAVIVPVLVVGNAHIAGSLRDDYADGSLALLVGLAVVCVVRWTSEDGRSLIALATLFLIGAAWTKNEGLLFSVALLLVTGVIARLRGRAWRQPALALAGVVLAILPWRLHLAFAGVGNTDYTLSDLLRPGLLASRSARSVAARGLWTTSLGLQRFPGSRSHLLAAIVGGRLGAGVAAAWMVVSLTGLTLIYWIDGWPIRLHLDTSAGRVVASVVVGAAIVSPIFLTQALDSSVRSGCGSGFLSLSNDKTIHAATSSLDRRRSQLQRADKETDRGGRGSERPKGRVGAPATLRPSALGLPRRTTSPCPSDVCRRLHRSQVGKTEGANVNWGEGRLLECSACWHGPGR